MRTFTFIGALLATATACSSSSSDEGTVAEREAAIDSVRTACSGEPDRECFWDAWRAQCARGQDDVIREVAECFVGDDTCRSVGDPGTTANIACVRAALDAGQTSAAETTATAYCAACPTDEALCTGNDSRTFGAPFQFLPDGDQPALQACLGAAADCGAAVECVEDAFAGLASCTSA